jgi:pimeloyl-ACP methyl ester carboxylesterase
LAKTLSSARTPWWERLPEDFHLQADGTELDASHGLEVLACAAMEYMARVPLSTVVAIAMAPSMLGPGRAAREFELLNFYEPFARAADPARVFRPPRKRIAIRSRPASDSPRLPADIRRFELRFDSPFKPLHPAAAPAFESMKRNAVAHAEHWCHGDRPRPTVIVVHGFAADSPWINARVLGLKDLYRSGLDILLFTYPHHGPRAERRAPFSGHGLFGNGLIHFNEVTLHAIHDLRVLIRHLRESGVEQIGVTGISMGGYTAALLSTVEDGLAFCIPVVPAASPIDTFLEWQPTGLLLSHLMRRAGVGVAEMRGLIAVHSPLTYAPRIDGERVLVIGGAADRISAPRHVRLLREHWPGSELHWFPGSHVVHLGRDKYVARMRAFIERWTRRAM